MSEARPSGGERPDTADTDDTLRDLVVVNDHTTNRAARPAPGCEQAVYDYVDARVEHVLLAKYNTSRNPLHLPPRGEPLGPEPVCGKDLRRAPKWRAQQLAVWPCGPEGLYRDFCSECLYEWFVEIDDSEVFE